MSPKDVLDSYGVLKTFVANLIKSGVKDISQIIVFGSVAKGSASTISDIDVLVLLKSENVSLREKIRHAAYKAMDGDNFERLISLHFMQEDEFNTLAMAGYSFEKAIASEGVQLWKAA